MGSRIGSFVRELAATYNVGNNFGRLNCDCLIQIFSYLPIVDRFNVESVCKQWKLASQQSWRSLKRLDVDITKWLASNVHQYTRVRITMYKAILERSGRYLTVVDFTYLCTKADDSEIFLLNRYDSAFSVYSKEYNITKHTNFHGITGLVSYSTKNPNFQGIEALATNCTKIEKLSLCSLIIKCDDAHLYRLFRKNTKISYLNLIGYNITGKCFSGLSAESIATLLLQRCQCELSANLCTLLSRCTNLKILSLWRTTTAGFHVRYENVIKLVASDIIKNLNELYLEENYDAFLRSYTLSNFRVNVALDNLTSIQINSVENEHIEQILIGIGANCKNLKMADFSGCSYVTDDMLVNITTLPKLEVLCIDQLRCITDRPLVHLSEHLKVLRCVGCRVTDAGLSNILSTSPNIELMDLSFCGSITNRIVNYAIDLTKGRTNNVVLNMYVKNTLIEEWKIEETSPFFRLHNAPTEHELLSIQLRNPRLLCSNTCYRMNRFDEKVCFQIDGAFRK